jgi:hypothetical protein
MLFWCRRLRALFNVLLLTLLLPASTYPLLTVGNPSSHKERVLSFLYKQAELIYIQFFLRFIIFFFFVVLFVYYLNIEWWNFIMISFSAPLTLRCVICIMNIQVVDVTVGWFTLCVVARACQWDPSWISCWWNIHKNHCIPRLTNKIENTIYITYTLRRLYLVVQCVLVG